ncbi:MAG: nuclear transport factor 2 family protein [Burkholderiaceae bacterium]|nr:nuclear transport factor 2 family protein [Burkholderiaceae bacterium]
MSARQEAEGHEAPASSTTRRAALAAALAMPLAAKPAGGNDATAELITRAAAKNAAFMRGDMQRWAQLVRIAPDFTLMQPFGGPASHGFDSSPERLAEMSRYFRNGKTELEVAKTYASNDLTVLVMIERQTGEVGGLPEQDWSLRVTEVYRKAGSDWELVHRHADALVRRISLEQLSALARGVSRG